MPAQVGDLGRQAHLFEFGLAHAVFELVEQLVDRGPRRAEARLEIAPDTILQQASWLPLD